MKKLILSVIILATSYIANSQEKTDCLDWDYYKTECLSNVSDGTGSSEAGIRRRVCKISETSSSVTAEVTLEPVNDGIDSRVAFYQGVKINFRGEDTITLSKEEFNNGGALKRTITINKSDLQGPYLKALNGWNKWTHMLFVSIECITR